MKKMSEINPRGFFLEARHKETLVPLMRKLSDRWIIQRIDLELCPYTDFHNGFDIEVSGGGNNSKYCDIYMWFDRRICAARLFNVLKSDIETLTDKLKDLSEWMIDKGFTKEEIRCYDTKHPLQTITGKTIKGKRAPWNLEHITHDCFIVETEGVR